jgi:hypothetical protein
MREKLRAILSLPSPSQITNSFANRYTSPIIET